MTTSAMITSTSVDDLLFQIDQKFEPKFDSIIQLIKNQSKQPDEEFLSRKEVCQVLRISEPTLWRLQKNGKIPFVQLGRKILFARTAVENTIRSNQN